MNDSIASISNRLYDQIVRIRRDIHRHPEIAFCEHRTANVIASFLEEHEISYRAGIAGTGLLAQIDGAQPGKTLLLRADMDALPLQEENDVNYRSENAGLMHACGHDAHCSILLGTTAILNELKEHLCGSVKFVFQPGEEDVGGALPMIEEGILENPSVDACAALHMSPLADAGDILLKPGAVTASPDDFEIRIQGRGGHGAMPHNTIDPIAIGCAVINALQLIVTRMVEANTPVVLSIGYFNAGTSPNIIPDFALIGGTLRTTDPVLREQIPKKIEEIVAGITHSMGAEYEFVFHYLFPPTINDPQLTETFLQSARRVIGAEHIVQQSAPLMIGEDFAYFGERVPSVLFYLGCRNEAEGIVCPLHSSRFNIDERSMMTGMRLLANFAFDYLCGA